MAEIALINITGKDRKGLSAEFTSILAQYNIIILDIGQATIHEYISLGILVQVMDSQDFPLMFKDMLFEGHKAGLKVNITQVSPEDYERWVGIQGKQRRVITLLGRSITAAQISAVCSQILAQGLNIDAISRLTERVSLAHPSAHPRVSVQFSVSGTPENIADMRARFMEISHNNSVDISFYVDNIYQKYRKLVVFDMDSTLIQTEIIDELAALGNVGEQVRSITASAMAGKIDFCESFRRRVELLKGIREQDLDGICEKLPLTEGAERVTRTLKNLGYKLAILSGGFTFVGKYLQEKLGFDYMYANELDIKDGRVTGKVTGDIVDGQKKAELLTFLAEKEGISIEQTIAVGDGANDMPMISIAGLGVAFNAKPLVRANATNSISTLGLDGLLYLIGIHDREIPKDEFGLN